MPLEQVVDEVAQHPIGPACPFVDDSTQEDACIALPLNIQGPLSIGLGAQHLGPTIRTARLMLLSGDKTEVSQLLVFGDLVPEARAFGTYNLNEGLHSLSPGRPVLPPTGSALVALTELLANS